MTGAAPLGVRVAGRGVALPDRVVTSADLETRQDTSDPWISGSAVLRWDSPGPGAARQDRPG